MRELAFEVDKKLSELNEKRESGVGSQFQDESKYEKGKKVKSVKEQKQTIVRNTGERLLDKSGQQMPSVASLAPSKQRTFKIENDQDKRQVTVDMEGGDGNESKIENQESEDASELTTDFEAAAIKRTTIKKLVLDPSGSFSYYWSFVVSLAFLYNFWSLSYRFAFQEINHETMPFWFTLDYSADFIYLLDIVVNFHTGYLEDGVLQKDIGRISLYYREQTLFYLDGFCLLPLDILYLSIGFNSILRCTRLVKIYKFWSYVDRTERHTNYPNVFRTFTLVHYILVIFHWNACLIHMISKNKLLNIENLFKINDNHCDDIPCQYLHAFYWSTLALTTIGDLPKPTTKGEYFYVIVELFFGLFIFASVLGHVANIVTNVSTARKEFQAKLDAVKTYMRVRRVSDDLQNKVISWFNYLWSSQKSSVEDNATACLPDRLKAEIAIHVHLDTLMRVDVFQNTEVGFLCELVLRLKPVLYSPGDYVCREDEIGREMYIVSRGVLEVVARNGQQVVATLRAGSYFGEISVLNLGQAGNKRTASVRSVGYSDLFCLFKQDLWDVLKNYPQTEARIRARAEERLRKLNMGNGRVQPQPSARQMPAPWAGNLQDPALRGSSCSGCEEIQRQLPQPQARSCNCDNIGQITCWRRSYRRHQSQHLRCNPCTKAMDSRRLELTPVVACRHHYCKSGLVAQGRAGGDCNAEVSGAHKSRDQGIGDKRLSEFGQEDKGEPTGCNETVASDGDNSSNSVGSTSTSSSSGSGFEHPSLSAALATIRPAATELNSGPVDRQEQQQQQKGSNFIRSHKETLAMASTHKLGEDSGRQCVSEAESGRHSRSNVNRPTTCSSSVQGLSSSATTLFVTPMDGNSCRASDVARSQAANEVCCATISGDCNSHLQRLKRVHRPQSGTRSNALICRLGADQLGAKLGSGCNSGLQPDLMELVRNRSSCDHHHHHHQLQTLMVQLDPHLERNQQEQPIYLLTPAVPLASHKFKSFSGRLRRPSSRIAAGSGAMPNASHHCKLAPPEPDPNQYQVPQIDGQPSYCEQSRSVDHSSSDHQAEQHRQTLPSENHQNKPISRHEAAS